jgi:hypothetical protein
VERSEVYETPYKWQTRLMGVVRGGWKFDASQMQTQYFAGLMEEIGNG